MLTGKAPRSKGEKYNNKRDGNHRLSQDSGKLFKTFDENEVENEVRRIMGLDWSRGSELFDGNILIGDKIVNSRGAIEAAVEKVEEHLGYQIN